MNNTHWFIDGDENHLQTYCNSHKYATQTIPLQYVYT